MSEIIGTAQLDLGFNYKAFENQLNGIANRTEKMVGGAFKKLGGIIAGAFVVDKLFNFGKASIGLASDLEEVQNVVDVVFESMSQDVNNFAKNALEAYGMSELSAKRFTSTMGAMLKSSDITGKQMLDMSKGITALTGDMASFYNLNHEETFRKIRSGLSGEVEPLRQLGINMSVANMEAFAMSKGIKKAWGSMTQAEQTLLRYNYLMSVTGDAQGDFARTSGSWANQTQILSEQWKSFQATMGAGFINVLTPVIQQLNILIKQLQVAANYFRAFTEAITGVQKDSSQASKSTMGVGVSAVSAAKDVKKAGKAIIGSLMGFDELNNLTEKTSENMDDMSEGMADIAIPDLGGMNGIDPVDIGIDPTTFDPFLSVLDTIRSKAIELGQFLVNTFGPPLQTALNSVVPELLKWKDTLANAFSGIGSLWAPLKDWFITEMIPVWQKGIVLAGHILSGLLDSSRKVFEGIKNAAMPVLEWFVNDGLSLLTDFKTQCLNLYKTIFDVAKSIFDTLWSGAIQPGLMVVSHMIVGLLDSLKGFWDKFGADIFAGVNQAFLNLQGLFMSLWGYLQPVVQNLLDELTWLWDKHLKGVVDEVLNFVGKLATGALEIYNKFVVPIAQWLIKELGPVFQEVFTIIGDVLGTALGIIADVVKGIIKALGGIIDFLVGVFTGNWEKAWEGVKNIFGGIFDAIIGILKGAVNLIIDGINSLIRGLNKIKVPEIDIPGMGKVGGFGFNIAQIPKLARGGIIDEPTLAMVGEKRKKEAVVPLEDTSFVDAIASAVATAVLQAMQLSQSNNNNNNNQQSEAVMQLDGIQIARLILPYIRNELNRTGVRLEGSL